MGRIDQVFNGNSIDTGPVIRREGSALRLTEQDAFQVRIRDLAQLTLGARVIGHDHQHSLAGSRPVRLGRLKHRRNGGAK